MRFHERSHLPAVLLLSFIFGSNLVVSRFALGQFNPVGLIAVRMPVAALAALLWTRLSYGRLPGGRRLWLHGAVVGFFATAVPMICFTAALQYQSSGVTALFITLTPISAMIIGHIRLHDDRMTVRKVAGAILSFSGVGLLLVTGQTGLQQTRWEGFLFVLAGVAGNGFGIVHLRKYLRNERILDIATVRLSVAAIAVLLLALLTGSFDYSRVRWSGVIAFIYGALPGTLIAFMLYSYVVARFGATKGTQTEYMVPVVATVAGALFLGERITLIMVAGMAVVFAGIALATGRPGGGPPQDVLP